MDTNYLKKLCPLINSNHTRYVGYWDDLELEPRFGVDDAIKAHVYYQVPTRTYIVLDLDNQVARVQYLDKNVASPNSRLTDIEKDVVREYMGFDDGPIALRDVFMSGIHTTDLIVDIPFGNKAKD